MRRFFKIVLWLLVVIFIIVPISMGVIYFFWGKNTISIKPQIGVVWVRGVISDSKEYVEGLRIFRENERVKAIVLRIDSPGGGVGPSQEIYRELEKTRDKKPVVASLGGIATSGGYYIASGSNKIVSNPGTVTGSIGVIIVFPNLEKLFEKVGYTATVIKSGEFKDMGNPGRAMTPEEQTLLKDTILEVHAQFVRDVAKARGMKEDDVARIADGRIMTGEKAKSLGLVDELGNFEDAVDLAKTMARIDEKPEIVYHEKKKRPIDFILGEETSSRIKEVFFEQANPIQWRLP